MQLALSVLRSQLMRSDFKVFYFQLADLGSVLHSYIHVHVHVYAVINTSYIHPYKTGDTFNENQAARHVCGFVGNKQLRDLAKTCNLMFSDSSSETLWTVHI